MYDGRSSYFKIILLDGEKKHYLKLHKLPEDIFYMIYCLNEVLQVSLNMVTNEIQYIFMTTLADKREFRKKMTELELRIFGQIHVSPGSDADAY